MKEIYDKELNCGKIIPETPLESVELLEEWLMADFGQKWTIPMLKAHFRICKNEIKKMAKPFKRGKTK